MKKRATTRTLSRRSTRAKTTTGRARKSAKTTTGRTQRSAKTTTDHDEIREWVESHGGHPAAVKQTRKGSQAAGVLRIDFPGNGRQASLQEISWDEWFETFDKRRLAFLYQAKEESRFNKLVSRHK